jgi:hypothetical protein
MGQSYRIRTELGINKTINIELDQDFEFLEILSLKIQQSEIYTRNCANYGVVVGRVTANNGLGLPNARVSIFIPIDTIDESNPLISSIYPYKSPNDRNEDGYRYNLLPYEKSYSKHAATGTLPGRLDVLTDNTVVEIYDKYYKYTTKTNDSGDYMIMGTPLGGQTLFMDVDLSDIGEFSLTPQDLIRMGLATESQVAGNQFKTSTDLNSLPQIVNIQQTVDVAPLWGDPAVCQIAVSRADFDLRDNANIDIQPTSVFMGSMFSSPDNMRVRPGCRPKDNLGNLCDLTTGPGQILALRQTINIDSNGLPILEVYQLEQAGNVIDGDGTWVTELPMNLDYYITNEFGEKVLSYDPTIGIPTKSKYRFKIKWQQANTPAEQTRRPYYLVPNIKEYSETKKHSSYYFGLDWTGYTENFLSGDDYNNRVNEIVNCEDTFYEFNFNRVYTVASLIDEYKEGGRGRFIGIKEIDDDSCASTNNKFPVNDGFRNFDFLFFLFSIIMVIIQIIGPILIIVGHIVLYLYRLVKSALCEICKFPGLGYVCDNLNIECNKWDATMELPMITYPDCQACECQVTTTNQVQKQYYVSGAGFLSYTSSRESYINYFKSYFSGTSIDEQILNSNAFCDATGGLSTISSFTFTQSTNWTTDTYSIYKITQSQPYVIPNQTYSKFAISSTLPLGERINIFNGRYNYFTGLNKIKVSVEPNSNIGKFHYDNTLTVLSNQAFTSGDLVTFVNPATSSDVNWAYSGFTLGGISGNTKGYVGGETTVNVVYADTQITEKTVQYSLPTGSTITNYEFASDREYFQVVTAITVSDAVTLWKNSNVNVDNQNSFPGIISTQTVIDWFGETAGPGSSWSSASYNFSLFDTYQNFGDQYIVIFQRGVDPYSPLYETEYDLSKIFGKEDFASDDNFVVKTKTRLNIPIQKLPDNNQIAVQKFTGQTDMFYSSYFFEPGIVGNTTPGYTYSGYSSTSTGYYGIADAYYSFYFNIVESPFVSNSNIQGISTITSNALYSYDIKPGKYNNGEELSGLGNMYITPYTNTWSNSSSPIVNFTSYTVIPANYSSFVELPVNGGPTFTSKLQDRLVRPKPTLMSNGSLNVMRTDRLPSSDVLDGYDWEYGCALLQQNLKFAIYGIDAKFETYSGPRYSTGASIVTAEIDGLPNSVTVAETFTCENMVGLSCYEGFGSNFQVNQNCVTSDQVVNGCYVFFQEPLNLGKDLGSFNEWGYRFRFFYGLCRGVLSQSFTNNWINGSLFAFPIQVNTTYDKNNKPKLPEYCENLVYFDSTTNNFYYRSSPYQQSPIPKFIGIDSPDSGVNDRNLLFPTTIMNLGMKDYFYSEITFDPSTKGYVIPNINPTSYNDTSDLINLFVISRITDENFLQRIISFGDNSLNQLFSRYENDPRKRRIDGDLAQLLSINSEVGVIGFSQEFYNDNSVQILGTANNPVIAVWFSSTTEDLQIKDYITPGRINFRTTDNLNNFPFTYGIKSQVVPFYQWNIDTSTGSTSVNVFGTQYNNWATKDTDIVQGRAYQSNDRERNPVSSPSYFLSPNVDLNTVSGETSARGYIFGVDSDGNYSTLGTLNNKVMVGAPFQFYFGVTKGQTALDKFKTKYSISE